MARSGRFGPTRRRGDSETAAAISTSLSNLSHLAKSYDSGAYSVAGLMAVEIRKIVSDNSGAIRERGTKTFLSTVQPGRPSTISAVHELVMARSGGKPPTLEFVAKFHAGGGPHPPHKCNFKTWLNKEVVYRASAAVPGVGPKGLIPVNGSPSLPFDKRLKFTRMDIVDLVRNKIGAHTEEDFPEVIDDLESGVDFGVFMIGSPTGDLSSADGTLPIKAGILSGSIRQITHELLEAYGFSDPSGLT